MRSRIAAALLLLGSPLAAQRCALPNANDVTCLTADYVRALGVLQDAWERSASDSANVANTFYAIKSGRMAAIDAKSYLSRYRHSRDTAVVRDARYVDEVLDDIVQRENVMEARLRRAAAGQMTSTQLEEGTADLRIWGDQLTRVMIASAGEVADASVVIDRSQTRVTARRMTRANRDSILAEISRIFPDSSQYATAWSIAAATLKRGLSDEWKYLP